MRSLLSAVLLLVLPPAASSAVLIPRVEVPPPVFSAAVPLGLGPAALPALSPTAAPALPVLPAPIIDGVPRWSAPAAPAPAAAARAAAPSPDAPSDASTRGRMLFDGGPGAHGEAVAAFMASVAATPGASAPALTRHFERVLAVGRHGRYDANPAVQRLIERIGRVKSLDQNKSFYLSGETTLKEGVLTIKIFALHHRPMPFFDKEMHVGRGETTGAKPAYPQVMYGIIKGAALKAASDPSIKVVRIVASRVMNEDLRKTLASIGFARGSERGFLGVEGLWPVDYVLDVQVAPRG